MIDIKTNIDWQGGKVVKAAERAAYENFRHAAASIRKDAQASIERSPEASSPGQAPHTRKGQLPKSIVFDANKEGAIVGPRESVVGQSAAAHEFGEVFHETAFDERPFMGPALANNLDRFASSWGGSIGE